MQLRTSVEGAQSLQSDDQNIMVQKSVDDHELEIAKFRNFDSNACAGA
jgi:hypothetical protein